MPILIVAVLVGTVLAWRKGWQLRALLPLVIGGVLALVLRGQLRIGWFFIAAGMVYWLAWMILHPLHIPEAPLRVREKKSGLAKARRVKGADRYLVKIFHRGELIESYRTDLQKPAAIRQAKKYLHVLLPKKGEKTGTDECEIKLEPTDFES